jgi:hypothetical protein
MQLTLRIDGRFLRRALAGCALALLLAAWLGPSLGRARQVMPPHRFTNGEVADADEVNANFDELSAGINDNDERLAALEAKVAAWEPILEHLSLVELDDGRGNKLRTVRFSGVNVQIVNGLGFTNGNAETQMLLEIDGNPVPVIANGLGNLIIGYQEHRAPFFADGREVSLPPDERTGSHNLVIGNWQNYTSVGGLVAGFGNAVAGIYAAVSGGAFGQASGLVSAVAGGSANHASGTASVVSGGNGNEARGISAGVSGGSGNLASGKHASVSGGGDNEAQGTASSVSGGESNIAEESRASIAGGASNRATGDAAAVSGGFENIASGTNASVAGGRGNQASGFAATVGGGQNRLADGPLDWRAGELFQDE